MMQCKATIFPSLPFVCESSLTCPSYKSLWYGLQITLATEIIFPVFDPGVIICMDITCRGKIRG